METKNQNQPNLGRKAQLKTKMKIWIWTRMKLPGQANHQDVTYNR
jgi:hypothetical protein